MESGMLEKFLVHVPDGDDFEFEGELIVDEHSHDIGFVQIWKTKGGRYILKQNKSSRPGFRSIYRVERYETAREVADVLGHTAGAETIARTLGVPRRITID